MGSLRINWAVVIFFIFNFIVLQFINDWQYRSFLDGGDSWVTVRYRTFTIPFIILAYYLFYRWQVPLLFRRKFGAFLLSVALFIVLFDIYILLVDRADQYLSGRRTQFNWRNYRFPVQSLHFTFINLLAITGFAYFLNRSREEKTAQQLKEQHLQLELNYLKAQLHPHFFFNTLNNIYSLALYRSEKTAPIVEKLSQLMRYIIYEGQKDRVPLEVEIDFLKSFVALEKIRHEDSVSISFTVQGNTDEIFVPPLLFMPLLENSFKHGADDNKDLRIEAAMLVENNEIIFEISNSRTAGSAAGEPGIGLMNLRKRLALLYPKKHELVIRKGDRQFEANLILKLS